MEESHLRVRKFQHPNGDTVMIPVENTNKTEGVNSNVSSGGSTDTGTSGMSNAALGCRGASTDMGAGGTSNAAPGCRSGSTDMGASGMSNMAPGGNNDERLFKRKLGESDMLENRKKTEEEIATEKVEEREAKKKDRDSLVLWGRPRTTLYYSLLETIILLKSLPSK